MCGCGEVILKIIIAVFNSVVAIFGLACIIFGAMVLKSDDLKDIDTKIQTGDLLHGTYLVIGVGAIILIISLMGCCGAICENKCMLLSYFIIVALILIAELVGAGLIWKNAPLFDKTLKETLQEEIGQYETDKKTRLFYDTIQKNLECCGVTSYTDYKEKPPTSCNNPKTNSPYETGCYDKVKSYLMKIANVVGSLAVVLTCLQIFSLATVLSLFCLLRKVATSNVA